MIDIDGREIMEVVPLLNPTEDNLTRGIRGLPLLFLQGILLQIQSLPSLPPPLQQPQQGQQLQEGQQPQTQTQTQPQGLDHEWYVQRLLKEIEDIGIELFVQRLDPETVHESCSILNLAANEDLVGLISFPFTIENNIFIIVW